MTPDNPFQMVLAIWRSVLVTFYRLPLLALGSLALYVLVSGYWQHSLPINIPRGLASQVAYDLLHAIIFAPLVFAVIQMIAKPDMRLADIWTSAALSVGIVIFVRELALMLEASLWREVRWGLVSWLVRHPSVNNAMNGQSLALKLLVAINLGLFLGVFLLSMRLVLLLPIVAMEKAEWRTALAKAWRIMRGSYGFSVVVACAALLPLLIADHLLVQLHRALYEPDVMSAPLSLRQWEVLTVRSAQLTLSYVTIAAMAGWLYRVIASRQATAPSPSHRSPARRPAV